MTEATSQAVRTDTASMARVLTVLQTLLWGIYLWALVLLLLAAADYGGLGFWPFASGGDMRDPKDVLPLGDGAGQILHLPVLLTVLFGLMPGALLLLAAIPLLIAQAKSGRMHRMLLVSTVMMGAVVAVQMTPFGALVRQWMLD